MAEGGSGRPKKARSVSIVVPGQRRSREQLYDPDDIILLDPSRAAASLDDSNLHKPMSPVQEKPPCPIELPPDFHKEKLSQKSKSLIPTDDDNIIPPSLSLTERTRSMGDIELPSMQKRTKPITLHNYRTKKLLEDRLINSNVKVWCLCKSVCFFRLCMLYLLCR